MGKMNSGIAEEANTWWFAATMENFIQCYIDRGVEYVEGDDNKIVRL